jgi:NAD(P)-dependent dehydrogenase (short-subunit alcohol dehydrogenase family)
MWKFENNNVMVTAGASGIGYAIATAFYDSGAKVHIVDIDQTALERVSETFPDIITSRADVSNEGAVEEVFDIQYDRTGPIHVLVNCAGIAGPTAAVEDVNFEDWHRCLGVNLDATFLCSRKAIPMMKSARYGRIINIASTAGWHGYPLRSSYSSAKWAVIGFTKSLAMEVGRFGITANAICPGSVEGDRMDRVIAAEAKEKNVPEAIIRGNYTRSCSMRTFISGQDIAAMALFLASDAASKISGQIMNVDGHMESFSGLD